MLYLLFANVFLDLIHYPVDRNALQSFVEPTVQRRMMRSDCLRFQNFANRSCHILQEAVSKHGGTFSDCG